MFKELAIAAGLAVTGSLFAGDVAQAGDGHHRQNQHGRLHDHLDHNEFHRDLEHREAHRYPMSSRGHARLHDSLDHDRFHDHLKHRQYHRNHSYRSHYYAPHSYGPHYGHHSQRLHRAPQHYGYGSFGSTRGVGIGVSPYGFSLRIGH